MFVICSFHNTLISPVLDHLCLWNLNIRNCGFIRVPFWRSMTQRSFCLLNILYLTIPCLFLAHLFWLLVFKLHQRTAQIYFVFDIISNLKLLKIWFSVGWVWNKKIKLLQLKITIKFTIRWRRLYTQFIICPFFN